MERTPAEKAILSRIKPEEGLPDIVNDTIRKAQDALGAQARATLGGSTAKGTFLAGDHDIDIFVRFDPKKASGKDISQALYAALSAAFTHVTRVHGSRDYFHVEREGYHFEFIPVLRVSSPEEARNVTDMSPLHVEYVTARIREAPDLADDARLLKQFCKAQKIYGAESYIGGLSGYMVELLVLHYGSFSRVLEAAAEWGEQVVLDPQGHHEDALAALNDAKTQAPLIMVDPVQPERNAAAALTHEAFGTFKAAAAEYLSTPEEAQANLFEVAPLDTDRFRKTHEDARVLAVHIEAQKAKADIAGAKCFKTFQYMIRELYRHGFAVHASDWEYKDERAMLLFAVQDGTLDAEEILVGPPLSMEEHAESFREEHRDTFEKDARIYARERRKFTDPQELLEHLCASKYVLERVERARVEQA